MSKEYIDREAVLQKRLLWIESNKRSVPVIMVEDIATIPAADVVEVRHGRWMVDTCKFYCSLCGEFEDYETVYCPNCGAKMDGGVNDE